jgi:hypothetical protein
LPLKTNATAFEQKRFPGWYFWIMIAWYIWKAFFQMESPFKTNATAFELNTLELIIFQMESPFKTKITAFEQKRFPGSFFWKSWLPGIYERPIVRHPKIWSESSSEKMSLQLSSHLYNNSYYILIYN